MQSMTTVVNPALRAAMDAASVLEQQANPIAPGPGGTEIKSISGQLMDAVHQRTTPAESSMGMGAGVGAGMGEGAGIQGILANMRNAAPMLQQQQQDQQTDQIASLAAQKLQGQQQPQQGGGIGGLPVSQGFAEGGILGFAQGGDPGEAYDAAKAEAAAAREALYRYGSVQKQRDPEGFTEAQRRYEAAQAAKNQAEQEWQKHARTMGLGAVQTGAPLKQISPEQAAQIRDADMQARMAAAYRDPNRPEHLDVPNAPAAAAPAAPQMTPDMLKALMARMGLGALPAGGGGGGGGIDPAQVAKYATAAEKYLGPNTSLEAADAATREYAEALRNQPLPGMAAMDILQKAQARREALYAQAEKDAPQRQLSALLSGIYRYGLPGGAESVRSMQEARMREIAAQITEQEVQGLKMAAIKDMQDGFRTGNLEKIAGAQEKLAKLRTDDRQVRANIYNHVFGGLASIAGHQISAAATRENADKRIAASMAAMMMKPQAKMSLADTLKLEEYLTQNFNSAMAPRSPVLKRALAQLKSPEANQLIRDIEADRVKYEKGVGWGKHAPIIQRAEQLYKSSLLSNVGPIDQAGGGATSYADALKDLTP